MQAFEEAEANYLAPTVKNWVFNTLIGDVLLNWRTGIRKPRSGGAGKTPSHLHDNKPHAAVQPRLHRLLCGELQQDPVTLDYDVFDRIMSKRGNLGVSFHRHFGRRASPLREQGKTILDIYENTVTLLPDVHERTLIDKAMAKKFAELGTSRPRYRGGLRKDTDRGGGRECTGRSSRPSTILRSRRPLRDILHRHAEKRQHILEDAFVDEFFGPRGAAFAWMFQYSPSDGARISI